MFKIKQHTLRISFPPSRVPCFFTERNIQSRSSTPWNNEPLIKLYTAGESSQTATLIARTISLHRKHDKLIYLFDKGKAVAPAVPAQEGDVMQYVD